MTPHGDLGRRRSDFFFCVLWWYMMVSAQKEVVFFYYSYWFFEVWGLWINALKMHLDTGTGLVLLVIHTSVYIFIHFSRKYWYFSCYKLPKFSQAVFYSCYLVLTCTDWVWNKVLLLQLLGYRRMQPMEIWAPTQRFSVMLEDVSGPLQPLLVACCLLRVC